MLRYPRMSTVQQLCMLCCELLCLAPQARDFRRDSSELCVLDRRSRHMHLEPLRFAVSFGVGRLAGSSVLFLLVCVMFLRTACGASQRCLHTRMNLCFHCRVDHFVTLVTSHFSSRSPSNQARTVGYRARVPRLSRVSCCGMCVAFCVIFLISW